MARTPGALRVTGSARMNGDGTETVLPLLEALSDAYNERDELQERIDRLQTELYTRVHTADQTDRASSEPHTSERRQRPGATGARARQERA